MNRRLEILLAVALASPAAAATPLPRSPASRPGSGSECEGLHVRLSPPDPVQGGIVRVEVDRGGPGEVAGTWRGRPVRFWRTRPGGPWSALLGVDLEQRPSESVELAVWAVGGTAPPCRVDVTVRPGDFAERRLTVARRYVEPGPRDLARAAREAAQLESIFGRAGAERLWSGPFRYPLDGVEPAPNFGQRRVLNGQPRSPHAGVDFSASTGTPVRATQRGRVVLSAPLFWTGRTVVVDHGLGLFSFYGHLSATAVRPGTIVRAGALLGRVGATGRATGPHLHWSIRLGTARVNPLDLVEPPSAGASPRSAATP